MCIRDSLYAVPSPPEVSRTAAGLAADAVQSCLQIGGVGAADVDPLTTAGVHEPEADSVPPLAFETQLLGKGWVRTVGQVTDAGMTQGGEVNPDLVGAPGLEMDLDQGGRPESLDHLVVGDARFAAGQHRELVVVVGVAPDRSVDGALHRIGQSLDKRVVGLVDRALLE